MKRVACIIIISILLTTVLLPSNLIAEEENVPDIISSAHYEKGYRYNIQGWIYIHIEGEPYERGYQYGYLAAAEIIDMIQRSSNYGHNIKFMRWFIIKNQPKNYDKLSEQWWNICKSRSVNKFWKQYPEEYKEEIKGIADGAKARGGKVFGNDIGYKDILALNEFQNSEWSIRYFRKSIHPFRGVFSGVKELLSGNIKKSNEPGHCSAFIATGDATTDGGIVVGHSTLFSPYIAERCNLILDVQPSDGHRFIMTTFPGAIWSNEDFYQNDCGIALTETALPQGPWKRRGVTIGVRARNAIQYSDSIDDVIASLLDGNNGLIPDEWLIGDTKTGEIASIELALYNTPIKRTFDGFYWSCNAPHDPKVAREVYGLGLTIVSKILPNLFVNPRAEKFIELEKQYYGTIDIEIAKRILSTYPICKGMTDGKITNYKLMENMGQLVVMGNPNGSRWDPSEENMNKFHGITELPVSGWVELYASSSQPNDTPSANQYNYDEKITNVLWTYETENTRNIDYSYSTVSNDVVYTATSTGRVYAFNASTGKELWNLNTGEKTVNPTVSKDLLFIGSDAGLHAIQKETGQIQWTGSTGEVSTQPVIYDELVIAGCVNGDIYAFDRDSGEIEWNYNLQDNRVFISEVQDHTVYIGSGESCYALDINNGGILWEYQTKGPITTAPVVHNNVVYFGSWDGNIYALQSETAELLWKYKTGWGIDTTPAIRDGVVFVGSNDNNFYALDANNGDLKWLFTCKSAIHSSPVIYGESVFFGSDDGRLYTLNRTTGSLTWSFTPGYFITDDVYNYITTPILSDPVVDNGIVFIGAKGNVYALDAQTVEAWTPSLEEKSSIPYITLLIIFVSLAVVVLIVLWYTYKYKR